MAKTRCIPNPKSALLSKAVIGGVGLGRPDDLEPPQGMATILLYVPVHEITTRPMQEIQADLGLPWSDQDGRPVWFDELGT